MTYQHLHIVFDLFLFHFYYFIILYMGPICICPFSFFTFVSCLCAHYSVLFNCLTGLEYAGSAIAHGGGYNAIVAGPLSCAANDRFHRWDVCKFPFRDNLIQSQ